MLKELYIHTCPPVRYVANNFTVVHHHWTVMDIPKVDVESASMSKCDVIEDGGVVKAVPWVLSHILCNIETKITVIESVVGIWVSL